MSPNYDTFIVYTSTYSSAEDAVHDFETVKSLYTDQKIIDTFDAAVLEKQSNGKVKIVKKHEQPTHEGLKLGAGLGLATGVAIALFPGAAIGARLLAATTGAGAIIGAVAGHVTGGLSRNDLKEMGETLDAGSAGLVVIAASDIEEKVRTAMKKSVKTMRKQVKANLKELEKELAQAAKEESVLVKH
jgi:uncharacterized membrane protein